MSFPPKSTRSRIWAFSGGFFWGYLRRGLGWLVASMSNYIFLLMKSICLLPCFKDIYLFYCFHHLCLNIWCIYIQFVIVFFLYNSCVWYKILQYLGILCVIIAFWASLLCTLRIQRRLTIRTVRLCYHVDHFSKLILWEWCRGNRLTIRTWIGWLFGVLSAIVQPYNGYLKHPVETMNPYLTHFRSV